MMIKKYLRFIFKVLFVALVVICGLFMLMISVSRINNEKKDSRFDDLKFNREIWIEFAQSENANNKRGLMYDDLVNNILHLGMDRSVVLELLGEPDLIYEDQIFCYNLGIWSEYSIE